MLEHTPGLTGPAQIRMRDSRVLEPSAAALLEGAVHDPEAWYLQTMVPRRVELDATTCGRRRLARTLLVLLETAAYLLRPQ